MFKIILRWAINAIALWAAITIVPGIHIQTQGNWWLAILGLALIFGLVNALVRPIVKSLACGLIVLTLGLAIFIINAGIESARKGNRAVSS